MDINVSLEDNNLNEINNIEKDVFKIKDEIAKILLTRKKSIFTKASEFWSKFNLWQKILIGSLIGVSLLVTGVIVKIAALIISGSIALAIYSGLSVLLQNHFNVEKESDLSITGIIEPLGNTLEAIIANIYDMYNTLTGKISDLSNEITKLSLVNESLSKTAEKIEQVEIELEKLKKINLTLNGTVRELSESIIDDKNQHEEFLSRLENFVADKDASFDKIVKRICSAEEELLHVKNELARNNERYSQLLQQHPQLLEQHSQLLTEHSRLLAEQKQQNSIELVHTNSHLSLNNNSFFTTQYNSLEEEKCNIEIKNI